MEEHSGQIGQEELSLEFIDKYLAREVSDVEAVQLFARRPGAKVMLEALREQLATAEIAPQTPAQRLGIARRILGERGQHHLPVGLSEDNEGGTVPSPVLVQVTPERLQPHSTRPERVIGKRPRVAFWGTLGAFSSLVVGFVGYLILPSFLSERPVDREYSTQRGQHINVTLDDGTQVWLAPETRLRYTASSQTGTRMVALDGQAIFSVKHHDRMPFVVQTGAIATRVLGTTFDVRHYPEDTTVRVAIQDGKVFVEDRVLTAGDVVWVNTSRFSSTVKQHQSVAEFTGWRTGNLVFRGARLAEVLPMLVRWYDVEFVLADPALAERRITVTFDAAELSQNALDLLSASLGVRYMHIGRTITFYP